MDEVEKAGSQSAFARMVGASQATISNLLLGKKMAGPRLAIRIEAVTDGRIRRHDLCPSASEIWPEKPTTEPVA
ncbi:transcriptional regulator [Microvirgula aerodenitrificans]|uniref:transcriptional regulator n=1 Tax=Microvirgula aerodenitrificans TaxID=57480 RepID=UPI0035714FE4